MKCGHSNESIWAILSTSNRDGVCLFFFRAPVWNDNSCVACESEGVNWALVYRSQVSRSWISSVRLKLDRTQQGYFYAFATVGFQLIGLVKKKMNEELKHETVICQGWLRGKTGEKDTFLHPMRTRYSLLNLFTHRNSITFDTLYLKQILQSKI